MKGRVYDTPTKRSLEVTIAKYVYLLTAMMLFAASIIAALVLNIRWYLFMLKRRGVLFTLKGIPLHLLYFIYASCAFSYCALKHKRCTVMGYLRQAQALISSS